MSRQSKPTPPFLLFRLVLAALLLVLLFGLERAWLAQPTLNVPDTTTVTVKPPPLLYTPEMLYQEIQPAPVAVLPPHEELPSSPVRKGDVRIAVIIDDVGISSKQTDPVFELPLKPTLSFLPYGDATPKLAARAAAAGYEIMLHMPMQPEGHNNPGPNALTVGLDAITVQERLRAALERVPQAVGVNNHMGSAATSDAALMQGFMDGLAPTGKFFVDSFTAATSVAGTTARAHGIASRRRDVFLDNDPAFDAIQRQIEAAERVARKRGSAIVIGHPYETTIAALKVWLPALESRGIKLVKVSELLRD